MQRPMENMELNIHYIIFNSKTQTIILFSNMEYIKIKKKIYVLYSLFLFKSLSMVTWKVHDAMRNKKKLSYNPKTNQDRTEVFIEFLS